MYVNRLINIIAPSLRPHSYICRRGGVKLVEEQIKNTIKTLFKPISRLTANLKVQSFNVKINLLRDCSLLL